MRVPSIANVMDKVQESRASFDKYVRILQRTYAESNFEHFLEEYVTILLNLFVTDRRIKNIYIQRSLEFMAKFVVSFCKNDEDHIFYTRLIQDILRHHVAVSPNVRQSVCEFIKLLLNGIGDANLDDDLCDEISLVMQARINDVKPSVRLQAVLASQRLQDPNNKDDPTLNSYIRAIVTESSPLIRKTIIECMAVNIRTIKHLLDRCLDANDSVRLAAYTKLSKIPVKLLRLEQRQFVLRNGLRSDGKVVDFTKRTLLSNWLSKYDGDYMEFCKALKLDATGEEFKQTTELLVNVLQSFFTLNPANDLKDILKLNQNKLPTSLTFESSLYWRCLIQFFASNPDNYIDFLEQVTPDLIALIEFIEMYYKEMTETTSEWEQLKENQIMNQFLQIVLTYEMLDSSERLRTRDFLIKVLTEANLQNDNILLLIKIFAKVEPDVNVRSQEICLIVSSIKDPVVCTQTVELSEEILRKRDLRIAPLRVKLNITRDDMDTAITKQEFQQADQLKRDISSLEKQIEDIKDEYKAQTVVSTVPKNEAQTISKCMDLLIAFLSSAKVKELNSALRSNMDNFVKPSLLTLADLNSDFKALKCFGLLCIIDKKEATSSLQLFCQQLLLYRYHCTYNQEGIIISATIVNDLLLIYGTNIFGENDTVELETTKRGQKKSLYDTTRLDQSLPEMETNATLQDVIEIYLEMLDDSNPELREIGGGCLIKLLYFNVVKAAGVLSKLIIKWFNPVTEKDIKLRQMLGIFFSDYVLRVPGSLNMIEKAFIPTLNVVCNAPPTSPLIDIDFDSLLKFLVDISRPHKQKRDHGLEVHKNLAVQLCNEICSKPNTPCVPLYVRTLLYLDIPYDDLVILEDLKNMGKKILAVLNQPTQKHLKKQIERYIEKLNNVELEQSSVHKTGSSEITENTLTDEMEDMSVNGRKRKRVPSNNSERLRTIDENRSDEEEVIIESANSDEDSPSSEKQPSNVEPTLPRRSLRRAARFQ